VIATFPAKRVQMQDNAPNPAASDAGAA